MMKEPKAIESASLEAIAMLSMEFGRLLMESGASARFVDEIVGMVARGLGAERVDTRIGYASLAVTARIGGGGITRMRKVGPLGVNQRLAHSLRELAGEVQRRKCTVSVAQARLNSLTQASPRHPGWLGDIAVRGACVAFGRLLGIDWVALVPVFLAAALGQWSRRVLAALQMNVFVAATFAGFIASALSGLGARLLGSLTMDTAMIASVLFLVPGVPSLNAQNDILEGYPTLGSARAVSVLVNLVFLTVGLWLGQMLLGEWRSVGASNPPGGPISLGLPYLLHQTLFGGLAAIGFGVLFNMGAHAVLWCGVGGALALAVRTMGLSQGWTLEGASFAAALAVGSGVRLYQERIGVSRNTLAVAGCIPMFPGGFAAKAILGLMALTQPTIQNADQTLIISVQDTLRVLFTVGAMGTGLAIPSMLLRVRRVNWAR
jgi:uncharacterized membrane protein YjjP (DUF1212 family)